MFFFRCVLLALVGTSAWARFTPALQNSIQDNDTANNKPNGASSLLGNLYYGFRLYKECAAADISTCLKMKLVAAMDRADRAYPEVNVIDGVSFVKEESAVSYDTPLSEDKLEEVLPRSLDGKNQALNALITDKITDFFSTHKLQVKLPTMSDLQRSFNGEARKKKKPSHQNYLIPLMVAGFVIPLSLVAVATFAGKALLVSVVAITLSGIVGLRNLFSYGSHHHHNHDHGPVSGHGQHLGHGHSIDHGPKIVVQAEGDDYGGGRYSERDESAHDIAYNSYSQKIR